MPRTSLVLIPTWRERGVGGCQKNAVHDLEVRFCKILARSNYRCGERWGLMEWIFIWPIEQILTSVVSRARARTRRHAELFPPGICGAFQWYFAWELVKVRSHKLAGNAFRTTEMADLAKEVESTHLLRTTPLYMLLTKMPRTSLALFPTWREQGVGGCQNTAVHHLEVWFRKILARSNYMWGQRWGLLEQIFISESRKLTAATG